mgnify:FL=1
MGGGRTKGGPRRRRPSHPSKSHISIHQQASAYTPPASSTDWAVPPPDGPLPGGPVDAVACVGPASGGGPRPPPDEAERVEYLCALQALDSPRDPRFDNITKLVR